MTLTSAAPSYDKYPSNGQLKTFPFIQNLKEENYSATVLHLLLAGIIGPDCWELFKVNQKLQSLACLQKCKYDQTQWGLTSE